MVDERPQRGNIKKEYYFETAEIKRRILKILPPYSWSSILQGLGTNKNRLSTSSPIRRAH